MNSATAAVSWLPDGFSQIFDCMCLALWALPYAAKFNPFLSLDCAQRLTPTTLAQSKERKGPNFAIWQPCTVLDVILALLRKIALRDVLI